MKIPRNTLIFLSSSAKLAVKYGLKEGFTKAATTTSPVGLAIDAATSVVSAIDSYNKLKTKKVHREKLKESIKLEEKRLKLIRSELSNQINIARKELSQELDIRLRLGKLTYMLAKACSLIIEELEDIRKSELPEFDVYDRKLTDLTNALLCFQDALSHVFKMHSKNDKDT